VQRVTGLLPRTCCAGNNFPGILRVLISRKLIEQVYLCEGELDVSERGATTGAAALAVEVRLFDENVYVSSDIQGSWVGSRLGVIRDLAQALWRDAYLQSMLYKTMFHIIYITICYE